MWGGVCAARPGLSAKPARLHALGQRRLGAALRCVDEGGICRERIGLRGCGRSACPQR